jgi:hypothetical protein
MIQSETLQRMLAESLRTTRSAVEIAIPPAFPLQPDTSGWLATRRRGHA